MSEPRFLPLEFDRLPPAQMRARARAMREELARRRSVRAFSDEPVPLDVLAECLRAAASAPSGANLQPWTFVVVTDPQKKREIREAAEREERKSYAQRMSEEWKRELELLGTDWRKPFLESAPALIAVFRHAWRRVDGEKRRLFYTAESVGIATGFLLVALHHAGLGTLTHTPSPMGFLERILARPPHERAWLLIPVGYPAHDCTVPDLARKPFEEVVLWQGARP